MSARDGRPAFPMTDAAVQDWIRGGLPHDQTLGMTLRDYFAAKVIAGDAATADGYAEEASDFALDGRARLAYRIADAMLKARQA